MRAAPEASIEWKGPNPHRYQERLTNRRCPQSRRVLDAVQVSTFKKQVEIQCEDGVKTAQKIYRLLREIYPLWRRRIDHIKHCLNGLLKLPAFAPLQLVKNGLEPLVGSLRF